MNRYRQLKALRCVTLFNQYLLQFFNYPEAREEKVPSVPPLGLCLCDLAVFFFNVTSA